MTEDQKVTKNTMREWVFEQELEAALATGDDRGMFQYSLPVWNKLRDRLGLTPLTERALLVRKVDHLKAAVAAGTYTQSRHSTAEHEQWMTDRGELLRAEQALLQHDVNEAREEPVQVPADWADEAREDASTV